MTTWHLARVRTGSEQAAAAELARLGFRPFLPMVTTWRDVPPRLRARLGRRQAVERPAFAGWLLAGVEPDAPAPDWHGTARHVLDFVRVDEPGAQARLAADVARLQAAAEAGDTNEVRKAADGLRERLDAIVGKRVAILDGALAGLEGTAEAVRGKRIEVSVAGLARVSVPIESLEERA